MKKCNECNIEKSLNEFYCRNVKNKKYQSKCKLCFLKLYQDIKNPGSKSFMRRKGYGKKEYKCFRCGKEFKANSTNRKYCSIKCKSEGISERLKFERELEIHSYPTFIKATY